MKKEILYSTFLILISFLSCNTTDPPVDKAELLLKLEDVSCTEAWITLTTNNIQMPVEINLIRTDANGSSKDEIFFVSTADSLLYIDSLLPNQTYTFHSVIQPGNQSSNELTVSTMDTTSHNFTFETWTFGGDAGSSTLYDVAIINENNIWAVGDINIADTSVNGYTMYNAVHWDGNEWVLKRIMFKTICGQQSSENAYPASSIIAFSENEIWVAQKGDQIAKIENGIQTQTICMPWTFSINKIWGTSSNDLYVVGNKGNIAHYQNGQWSWLESETTTPINDIWGIVNPITQEQIIYCPVSYVFDPGDRKILTIKNNKVDSLSWDSGRRLHSVWSKNGLCIYTAGGGFYENKSGFWNEINIAAFYGRNIRGTDYNNIFVCGDYGLFAHFNGSEWKTFNELYIQGIYYSVAAKNNIVVTVGFKGSNAIIVKGTRN